MDSLLQHVSDSRLEGFINAVTDVGLKVLGTIALVLVALWVAGKLQKAVVRSLERAQIDVTLTRFLGQITKYAVLVLVGLAILSLFGVETTSFAAVIAASGLAIGLAFQGSLSNLAAGVMLLIFRPFRVGQVISVAGHTGSIDEIGLFTTTLDTPDKRRVILPNSGVFGSTIENITHHPTRRVDVSVGVDYQAGIDETRAVLLKALNEVPGVLTDPAPVAVLCELGASSVDWSLRAWSKTEDYWAVRESMVAAAKKALDSAKIGIPFPQMDIHVQADSVSRDLAAFTPDTTSSLPQ